ncbi:hypothetical protein XarjCFBP7653_17260 [Xanthomonas arboricola]|nr:hypothetical protein XarjCFBP7653_17260 [Xanthomonas arboricola]
MLASSVHGHLCCRLMDIWITLEIIANEWRQLDLSVSGVLRRKVYVEGIDGNYFLQEIFD